MYAAFVQCLEYFLERLTGRMFIPLDGILNFYFCTVRSKTKLLGGYVWITGEIKWHPSKSERPWLRRELHAAYNNKWIRKGEFERGGK